MPYRVDSKAIADALVKYWKLNWSYDVNSSDELYYSVRPSYGNQYHPYWREINDAFVAGWNAQMDE